MHGLPAIVRHGLALSTILAGLSIISPGAEATGIVHNGVARACIMIAPDAHQMEKEAALDLQDLVQRATGAQLKLIEVAGPPDRLVPIRIGKAAAEAISEASRNLLRDWPYDGAVIEADSGGVNIIGPTPAGTANGVATVLMDDVRARAYYPHALFTIVPRARSLDIRSRAVKPSFDYRVWSGIVGEEAKAYQRRNRLSDQRIPVPYFGFGHNLGRIIPVEKYGEAHPEYFAFRDGRHRPEGTGVAHAAQPCFTNPEVIQLTVEAARKYFDEHPDRNTFSLCVNDNPRYCECEKCAAMDLPYRDLPVGRQYSESYYDYVSRVAEAIARSHPDRYLGVYAYWNVEQPPRNRRDLPGNVIVALTLDILQHYDPDYQKKDRALIEAWSGYADRLHTYVYYGLGWYTPRTSPRLVAEDLQFAAQHGVRAIYCEAYPFWAWCGPMHYLAARLQWDIDADVETILDEFHEDCFEDAAAQMRSFHDACERYWTRPRKGRWFEGLDRLGPEEAMADTGILREAQGHLEAAFKEARSARVRRRIAWIREGFDFTMAIAEAFEVKNRPAANIEELVSAADAADKAYQRLTADPAYAHSYYKEGDRFNGKCWGWFKQPVLTAAASQWEQMKADAPAEAAKQWQAYERRIGLTGLLQKREWELGFDPGSD